MMVGYAFHVRLFHSLLFAGFHRRFHNVPDLKSQTELRVYFLGKAPMSLDKNNIRIEGGARIRNIRVIDVDMCHYRHHELDDFMVVRVDKPGDFSTYTLRVVERNYEGAWQPHSAFDPRYDRIDFTFKAGCPSDLDCKQPVLCPPLERKTPEINYFAKDYESFRQLILDRLALVMPDWKERHAPDIGVALTEVLAYVGDHLSYFQDAVATEAYLDTARNRISVRRHARLVDYSMHEGCNARAWVCIETGSDLPPIDVDKLFFITGLDGDTTATKAILSEEELQTMSSSAIETFEPVRDTTGQPETFRFYQDHSTIAFHTWANRECCLPKGTTHATLIGQLHVDVQEETFSCKSDEKPTELTETPEQSDEQKVLIDNESTPKLHLASGDVLIFEEILGPETGHPGDADSQHRHAVRLTKVEAGIDPLSGQPIVEIDWAEEDALPFPLCLSSLGPPSRECAVLENVSVARGNVVLVDHGKSMKDDDLGTVPEKEIIDCCKSEGIEADRIAVPGLYRPSLRLVPLTFSQPLVASLSASVLLAQDVREALPQVTLNDDSGQDAGHRWEPRSDLLSSGSDDRHFVAEIDNEGRARLRFGDDRSGEQPDAGLQFRAEYRVGNGPKGNVGAETIRIMILRNPTLDGVAIRVRNPLPAQGGTAPEPTAQVKLFAPNLFRKELQRAITADDYAAIVEREFRDKVQRAAARLQWNGSWHEVLVAVDPYGREEAEPSLLEAISDRLYRYRRMGHDLKVRAARRVPLEIEMTVCVLPNYLRGHVKAELLAFFSKRLLPDGRRGFFHPDNLTFGDDIYLSRLVAVAQAVEGVESVIITKLQRLNELPNEEIENGVLPLGPFEIARLDNDPDFPENGKLTLIMVGGK
jgi:hypothetical protein